MDKIDELCVNTLRMLSVDMVEKARSGHPGMPMGAAPMAYVLWTRFLRHNPENPRWINRDRFILSAGHASALLYSLLYLTGYDLSLDELKRFRQWGSRTPGHPEYRTTPGVETTTGPLGQGLANAVGMAIAQQFIAAHFNRPGHEIIDHYIYVMVSDGDLMEGISHEAASLAGHLRLGRLIFLYDNNQISIEGSTQLTFTEDVLKRFDAYGWHVQEVEEGNDLSAIHGAIEAAIKDPRPSFISIKTIIGYGSPNRQGTSKSHGEPLGPEEAELTKKNLGWPVEPFYVPEEALNHFRKAIEQGRKWEEDWNIRYEAYKKEYPEEAARLEKLFRGELPQDWDKELPAFEPSQDGMPTRVASGKVLNILASRIPNIIGGSADLGPSNKTLISEAGDFGPDNYKGRNLRFGVREHAMGAILNGMALYNGLIPYGGTFLVFSEYMRPAIRMAAIMRLKVIYIFSHDSIGVGEDGPTHQPIEQLASLRSIPGLTVIRPCDANEVVEAWRYAIEEKDGPVALVLTRQTLPVIDRKGLSPATGLRKGAYVLKEAGGKTDVVLIATGSEVYPVLGAAEILESKGIGARVVSMPCCEIFDKQPEDYKRKIIPDDAKLKVAIEAGISAGWHKYVGCDGEVIGIDRFGASAPYKVLFEKFCFTPEAIAERVEKAMYSKGLIRG